MSIIQGKYILADICELGVAACLITSCVEAHTSVLVCAPKFVFRVVRSTLVVTVTEGTYIYLPCVRVMALMPTSILFLLVCQCLDTSLYNSISLAMHRKQAT
jgi:hypothetical protein